MTYQFRGRPFSLSLSPRVFTWVVQATLEPLQQEGILILPFLDDWLLCARLPQQFISSTQSLLHHGATLGLRVNLSVLPGIGSGVQINEGHSDRHQNADTLEDLGKVPGSPQVALHQLDTAGLPSHGGFIGYSVTVFSTQGADDHRCFPQREDFGNIMVCGATGTPCSGHCVPNYWSCGQSFSLCNISGANFQETTF